MAIYIEKLTLTCNEDNEVFFLDIYNIYNTKNVKVINLKYIKKHRPIS